jgi:RND family efflux transporter MFP subunit
MSFIKKMLGNFKLFFSNKIESLVYYVNETLRIKFTSFLTNLIPDKDITKTSILFYIIAIFCLITVIWGSLARVDMVVRGTGEVIPASKVKVIQSVFPGVIEKININLGDKVKKGDVLFVVDEVRAKASYISNEREYEASLLEVETLEKRTQIIEDLVNQGAESEMKLLDERLRLVASKKNLAQAESNRAIQKQQLDQTKIISTSNGIINEVYVTTIGAVVSAAEILARLVPEDEKLVVQVYIEPKDISFVENGMKAKVTFATYDPSIYGTFEGYITEVGATTTDVKDRGLLYEARVEVKDEKTKDIIIQSGMSAEISLIGQKRTVFGYIFSPVTKLKRKAFREK